MFNLSPKCATIKGSLFLTWISSWLHDCILPRALVPSLLSIDATMMIPRRSFRFDLQSHSLILNILNIFINDELSSVQGRKKNTYSGLGTSEDMEGKPTSIELMWAFTRNPIVLSSSLAVFLRRANLTMLYRTEFGHQGLVECSVQADKVEANIMRLLYVVWDCFLKTGTRFLGDFRTETSHGDNGSISHLETKRRVVAPWKEIIIVCSSSLVYTFRYGVVRTWSEVR